MDTSIQTSRLWESLLSRSACQASPDHHDPEMTVACHGSRHRKMTCAAVTSVASTTAFVNA